MNMDLTKYRHIIWDWNGTLIDDAWLCVQILNKLRAKRRMPPITLRQYQDEFDFPVQDYYRRIGFDFSVESFDAVATEFIQEYDQRRYECSLQPGAMGVLQTLHERGFPQSILSAYQQPRLEQAVEFFGIRHYFTHVLGLDDDYACSKVDNGRDMIRRLGIPPRQVLFIGDTLHDFETATAMGTDCILIPSGHHPRNRLETCGVCVLNSLTDFPAVSA